MRIVSALFLLALAICAHSEKCPSDEELDRCYCENVVDTDNILVSCSGELDDDGETLTLNDLKQQLKSLVGKNNVEIDLDEINLGKLPSKLFDGIGVIRLDIFHCDLDSLTDNEDEPALAGLENTLEELQIMSSFEEKIKLNLGHMKKLKEIDISYNIIIEVSDDWFDKGPMSLEYLHLENNGIEKLGSKAFANLANLKTLSIVGNRFGPIKRSMLPSLAGNLKELEFDNNAWTSIPEDIFSGMPALNSISFRNNGITRLEQHTWETILEQLDAIYLQGNPLECDSHMDWMFNMRITSAIFGKCAAPREKEGTSLKDFLDLKRK